MSQVDSQSHAHPVPAPLDLGGDGPTGNCTLDLQIFNALRSALPLPTVNHIYSTFLGDTRERVAALRAVRDLSTIPSMLPATAHAIRGSAGMIGATKIASLAEQMDEQSESLGGLLAACEQLQNRLRAEGLDL